MAREPGSGTGGAWPRLLAPPPPPQCQAVEQIQAWKEGSGPQADPLSWGITVSRGAVEARTGRKSGQSRTTA